MSDLEAIMAISAQMAFALRPFAELAAPLVDQKADTAIGLTDADFENARLALHQWNKALPTIDWNDLDRARVARLEAALRDCKRYAEDHDDEWVPHRVDDAFAETGES